MSSRKRVGLVLGCGASRGWAHIGIIEALVEANISIDFIAGRVGVLFHIELSKTMKQNTINQRQ